MDKGTITYKGANYATSTMRFEGVASLAAVNTLQTALSAFSACDASREAFSTSTDYDVAGAGNVDKKAIITTKDTNGHVHKWALPGYSGSIETDNEGEKVEAVALGTIITAIETATGLSLSPLRSPVIQTA